MESFSKLLFYFGLVLHLFVLFLEFKKKLYTFRYPFLYILVVIGWIYPQLYSMLYQNLYTDILWKLELFIILCTISVYTGFYYNKKTVKYLKWKINLNKLIWFNLWLFLIGAFFDHKVNLISEEATLSFGGQWQGIITVYVFFAKLISVSLGTALVISLYQKSYLNLFVILGSSYFYLERVILGGRRQELFEFFIILTLWFYWRKKLIIPRLVFIFFSITGIILVNLIGIYRSLTVDSNIKIECFTLKLYLAHQVDWMDAFKEHLLNGANEVLNASLIVSASEKLFSFDFGLSIWNSFVFNYIPATFLGREFKEGLMFSFPDAAYKVYGHTPLVGSTFTGYSDAFRSFWYFGFLNFFLIAYIMGIWFRSSFYEDNITAKIILTQLYAFSLLAITHTTHHFFLEFIKLAVFLIPMLYLSRKREAIHK